MSDRRTAKPAKVLVEYTLHLNDPKDLRPASQIPNETYDNKFFALLRAANFISDAPISTTMEGWELLVRKTIYKSGVPVMQSNVAIFYIEGGNHAN